VRYSGEARVAAVDAIVELYLQDADVDALLRDVGLADEKIARDQAPAEEATLPVSPAEEQYRRLCGIADRARELGSRLRNARVSFDYMRSGSSRQAVLIRSEGHCENPQCTGEPQDITDAGDPILEVDHVHDLAQRGPGHPSNMIALCPTAMPSRPAGGPANSCARSYS
jgi:5-methylcytosine-specific restriction enzyme A